ncbi:helix-turn-helix domain-containing protein [Agrobacterium sp. 22094]|uniref:helix-turn-helix domain-containing protein n=1 Tax=Agrobacterium sp. 22094 TaxID=3453872 RepID=UPI003F8598CC
MEQATVADNDFDVDSRLKTLRTNAGLSQRQLAECAHVPHAHIDNRAEQVEPIGLDAAENPWEPRRKRGGFLRRRPIWLAERAFFRFQ